MSLIKKSFLAIAILAFGLALLPACLGKEQASTSTPPPLETVANASAANSLKLSIPIGCNLGRDCFIMHYQDLDPSPKEVDFGCGRQTYDGHNGTDFAIPDARAMAAGVPVKASAAGTVLRVRDGVPDRRVEDQTDKTSVQGIECGNGVVIDHGNGWQTQYCHLRQGSIAVKPGTKVEAGTVLGMVGESGLASFPHVHLTVRYQDKVVDPFIGMNAGAGCQVSRQPLWAQPLDYVPTGLIRAGFATQPPKMADLWQGRYFETLLSRTSPALVFWVQDYGVLQGDDEEFRLFAPDGTSAVNLKQTLKASNRVWLSYIGKNASNSPLLPGVWRGEYRLSRGGKVLVDVKREVQIR